MSLKNKKTFKILIYSIISILLLSLSFWYICTDRVKIDKTSLIEQKSLTKNTEENIFEELKDKTKTEYYCLNNKFQNFSKLLAKYKNDKLEIKKKMANDKKFKYNFKWEQKNGDWYLNTLDWDFKIDNKKGKEAKQDIVWHKNKCIFDKNKINLNCSVVSHKGYTWKLNFKNLGDDFIFISLIKQAVSTEAKQKQKLAEFFGAKFSNDDHICVVHGLSPFAAN